MLCKFISKIREMRYIAVCVYSWIMYCTHAYEYMNVQLLLMLVWFGLMVQQHYEGLFIPSGLYTHCSKIPRIK